MSLPGASASSRHTGALHFTVTVFATAAFGDVTATTEAAWGVTGQMINLIIIRIGAELSRARSSKVDNGVREAQTPRRPAIRPRNLPPHRNNDDGKLSL
jgi:hypothetical protein